MQQLIEVFSKLNWIFLSYEGPLRKQELPVTAVKRLPPEVFAEWPAKKVFAGVTSELIGIKISREFLSQSNLEQCTKLLIDLIEFGLYADCDVTAHRYDERGQRLPTSEILHIAIGSK